jgi:putative ABC transport system substrate-binding protein
MGRRHPRAAPVVVNRLYAAYAGAFIAILVVAMPLVSSTQPAAKVPRIGLLMSPSGPLVDAFRQGLRELGYLEGQNIVIEYRWSDAGPERLPALAAELVRQKVDVIVASSQGAVAAKQATTEIPIVMPIITDPVRLGLVASLARPGGNATGFATQNDELPGKWLELVKETLPKASRIAILLHPSYDGGVQLKGAEAAARSLGVRLQALNVEHPDDFLTAFAEAGRNRSEALIVSSSPLFYVNRSRLVEFATRARLPTIYHQSEFVVESAGLMSYGPDFRDQFKRSATYVDRILKGAKPGDLPVQQPTKFELVINLGAAKTLSLTIPAGVLHRADRVIQ